MDNNLILYILLAAVISILLAAFQYIYKGKNKTNWILLFLRSFSIFGILLLLINPKFLKKELYLIKPKLILLSDNTSSIKSVSSFDLNAKITDLKNNKDLQSKFEIENYYFTNDILKKDSLDFKGTQTNIYNSLKSIQTLFEKEIAPILLFTDGNQTNGTTYKYLKLKNEVYPIIIGDTTEYQDVKITQLNTNTYAYLKHKFPVEIFVNYQGENTGIQLNITVKEGKTTVFSKKITLGKNKNSKKISFYIPASTVGIHYYTAHISNLKNEKNTKNNTQKFTVEVLNEQAKIVLISDITHPDIAMLKRAIESNKQQKIIIKKPTDNLDLSKYKMIILYQPNAKFLKLFSQIKKNKKNSFIFTGTHTDWNFLNNNQSILKKEILSKNEDYLANYNKSFSTFLTEDINFNNFPPVQDKFGEITFSTPFETLLWQQIDNFTTKSPLLAVSENNKIRTCFFFGENIWRWRLNSFLENKSFTKFDTFIQKNIQYLSSSKTGNYLEIEAKRNYFANENITIKAKIYDANYIFDHKKQLWISITNNKTKKQIKYPFSLKNNHFESNISGLSEGNYKFTVYDSKKTQKKYGNFTILGYNVEQQFIGANKNDLKQLANNTNGKIFYPNQIEKLIQTLLENPKYNSIQKSKETKIPLIDWKWLLSIIIALLSIEWFLRKYKGYL